MSSKSIHPHDPDAGQARLFQIGYILSRRGDWIWFLALPLVALAAALGSQRWLPYVALASVNLWITIPHHFSTWFRTYGIHEDWQRFKQRLIVGPLVIFAVVFAGLQVAPITLLLVIILWDSQHSIMQQHGFGRIYDFKAGSGSPRTPRFDLALHWILFGNMFLNAPMFVTMWLRELYRLNLLIPVSAVRFIQLASWTVTAAYLAVYLVHVLVSIRRGYPLNPIKYLFIAASYFLWYTAAWHTASIMVFGIAHRLMHGLQYNVMVLHYVKRKSRGTANSSRFWLLRQLRAGNLLLFAVVGLLYALCFQLITLAPLDEFGFGLVHFTDHYHAIPEHGIKAMPG
ncbi:MAG: hypothetical protein VB855_04820, partial [Pirellulaceae bacterium]